MQHIFSCSSGPKGHPRNIITHYRHLIIYSRFGWVDIHSKHCRTLEKTKIYLGIFFTTMNN